MARRTLAGILAMLVVGGITRAAPVTDPGVIVVTGENLSGDWDFKGTVLVKSPVDDPAIPDFINGSFTVSGGDPTYSGAGTLNGTAATIEGVNATADPFTTTITISDHITTTDSNTTFNGTLTSGDFVTGLFRGGTLDGLKSWEGTFTVQITRPPTQTPAEQIASAYLTTVADIGNTTALVESAIQAAAAEAASRLRLAPDLRSALLILNQARGTMEEMKRAASRSVAAEFARFTEVSREIIEAAPETDRRSLRRLAARRTASLGHEVGSSNARISHVLKDEMDKLFDDVDDRRKGGKKEPPGRKEEPLVEIRNDGTSTYKYEFMTKTTKVKLGAVRDQGGKVQNRFEVIFPKGSDECPNRVSQQIKRTLTITDANGNTTEDKRPRDTGQEGTEYEEDGTPGDRAQDKAKDRKDGKKSYYDDPGTPMYANATKVEYKADFRIRVYCIDQDGKVHEIECWQFKVTIIIERDENGKAVIKKNELTDLKRCD